MTYLPSMYRVHRIGDPILREVSEEVTDFSDHELTMTIERMRATLDKSGGIGICAPQVGLNQRIFIWNLPEDESSDKVLINPVITETSGTISIYEGCLSIPDEFFELERPERLRVTGQDLHGEDIEYEAWGMFARLVLHEVDHLNGVLVTDRLSDDQWSEFRTAFARRHGVLCPEDWRQPLAS